MSSLVRTSSRLRPPFLLGVKIKTKKRRSQQQLLTHLDGEKDSDESMEDESSILAVAASDFESDAKRPRVRRRRISAFEGGIDLQVVPSVHDSRHGAAQNGPSYDAGTSRIRYDAGNIWIGLCLSGRRGRERSDSRNDKPPRTRN